MRAESEGCASYFHLIKAVDLKEVSPRLKPPLMGKSQALEGVAAMGIQRSALDGSTLGLPLQLRTAQAN